MIKRILLSSVLLFSLTGCMNDLIDKSTDSIYTNQAAVQRSTEVIHENARLIDESNRVIEENHRLILKMSEQ